MYDLSQYNGRSVGCIKEAGNIGAGNAATALSTLLRQDIDMKVPAVRICHFNELIESIGGAELPLAAIYLRVQGMRQEICSFRFNLLKQSYLYII